MTLCLSRQQQANYQLSEYEWTIVLVAGKLVEKSAEVYRL